MAFQPKYRKQVGEQLAVVVDDSNCVMVEFFGLALPIEGEEHVARVTVTRAGVLSEVLREALRIQKLRDEQTREGPDWVLDYVQGHNWTWVPK